MPGPSNSINESTTGICGFTSTAFVGSPSTQYNVQVGGSTSSTLANVAPSATSGVPLISQGAASNPAFGTAVVAGGGTGAVTLTGVLIGNGTSAVTGNAVTQYDVLVGGASNAISSIGPGSAGQVLQSGGAASNPVYSTATYPSTATGTGKILRANGTNWVATTATYPDTAGTSGNVLTSDGTNWNSTAPASTGILSVSGTMTSAQIKAANASPLQIIASPGAGNSIMIVAVSLKYVYGGTNVFVAGAAQTISIAYGTTTTGLTNTVGNFNINNNRLVNAFSALSVGQSGITSSSSLFDLAVFLYNPVATEITGNAANDNTIIYKFLYYIV